LAIKILAQAKILVLSNL